MEQLNNLDVVFLVIIGVSSLVAIVRGATKELLSILGWVLAGLSVYYLLPIVDPITKKYVASEIMASIISGLVILVVFCVFWLLTADKICYHVRYSKLSPLDRVFGFLFGIVRAIVIVVLIQIMITTLIPEESQKGVFAESRGFQMAGELATPVKEVIPMEWLDDLRKKMEGFGFGKSENEEEKVKDENEKVAETSSADPKNENSGATTEDNGVDLGDEDDNLAALKQSGVEFFNELIASDPNMAGKDESEKTDGIMSGENFEALKKSGEELFNELVQPKTEVDLSGATDDGYDNDETSDLERLMGILEDTIVTEEPVNVEIKNSPEVIENLVENVAK